MKYIDADKLIAEIERRLNIVEPHKDTFESAAASRQELIWMKDFITSLQQEQSEVDLEKEVENYFKGWHIEEEIGLTKPDGWSCIVADLKDIAHDFYELGLNARKED